MNTKREKTGRKLLSFLFTLVMILGLVPGMSLTAYAADNSTDYVLTIPATLDVQQAGWNATDGLAAQVKSGDTFSATKKLSVTASSSNNLTLKSGDNSVGYTLTTASGGSQTTTWEFSADELNASGGTTKAMGIIVEDYSTKPAGTYQDTVTFTASVEDARQLYNITLTGPYSNFTLVMEFYEGDTWNDMATKYPDYIQIYNKWPGFHTDGLIYEATGAKVLATDVIDPNKTYKIE